MRLLGLVMYNEAYKRLLMLWRYKFNMLMKLVGVIFIFVGFGVIIPGGSISATTLAPTFLGYIVWFYARFVVSAASSDLVMETYTGTLEQIYMSPVSASFLLLARLFALLISTTILVILPTVGIILLWHITIPFRLAAMPVFIITLVGLFGFSLALSGLSLVFKQIDDASILIQLLLLFLTGTILPIDRFPSWLEPIARALPLTQGIALLKMLIFDGQSLATVWANGSIFWLVLNSLIYVCVGLLIYRWGEHTAKNHGLLGLY